MLLHDNVFHITWKVRTFHWIFHYTYGIGLILNITDLSGKLWGDGQFLGWWQHWGCQIHNSRWCQRPKKTWLSLDPDLLCHRNTTRIYCITLTLVFYCFGLGSLSFAFGLQMVSSSPLGIVQFGFQGIRKIPIQMEKWILESCLIKLIQISNGSFCPRSTGKAGQDYQEHA